jgi:hypothetical protein
VSVKETKGAVTIPIAQAVIRSLAVNAVKGDQRAQRLFAELLASVEGANKRLHDDWLETAIEYKTSWDRELERRKRLGITDAPEPLPHPDDVVISMRTGEVEIKGPMTREEKIAWDRVRERKEECDRTIAELEEVLAKQPDHPHRGAISEELEYEGKIRAIISRGFPV